MGIDDIRRKWGGSVIIGGDFNAKLKAWGSPNIDSRGDEMQTWTVEGPTEKVI